VFSAFEARRAVSLITLHWEQSPAFKSEVSKDDVQLLVKLKSVLGVQ
jgi:hypothetical protein